MDRADSTTLDNKLVTMSDCDEIAHLNTLVVEQKKVLEKVGINHGSFHGGNVMVSKIGTLTDDGSLTVKWKITFVDFGKASLITQATGDSDKVLIPESKPVVNVPKTIPHATTMTS